MPLRPGDIFSVVLPNFVGADTASDQSLEFENDPSTFGRVAWRSANHTLSLSVNESVEAGVINVSVLSSGIVIPVEGIREDHRSAITIAVDAALGPILEMPVRAVPMIGSFT